MSPSTGKIAKWNDSKGYGFIDPGVGENQIFFHINSFSNYDQRPKPGQLVSYTESTDKHGRVCAVKVNLVGSRLPRNTDKKGISFPHLVAFCFFGIVGIAVVTSKIPFLILVIYIVVSILTFVMYALDKWSAKQGKWRTPESTLHLLSLAGGWPGALLAQQTLRHKSSKQPFRIVFWATVLINCGILVWLFTPTGAAELQSLIARIK